MNFGNVPTLTDSLNPVLNISQGILKTKNGSLNVNQLNYVEGDIGIYT